MTTPSQVISASFDRLATTTSINDKIGSIRTIKSLLGNNLKDVITHITDLFELLKETNKDLLALVVECLFILLNKDKSLSKVFGMYIESFYALLECKNTTVLFHSLNILIQLDPLVLYDKIQPDTISHLLVCIDNDVLTNAALDVLVILSLHPPIQYQLLFQGLDPLITLMWECLHHDPVPLASILTVLLHMLKHPKGLELIQDAYANTFIKQFHTCWMGLVHLLVKDHYSLPNKVIVSTHYFQQYCIQQFKEHEQFNASISKQSTSDSLLSFWFIPHEEWMIWDDPMHLFCQLLLHLKPSALILDSVVEIATTWGVPLQTRAYAWRLLLHFNQNDIVNKSCFMLVNNVFVSQPLWEVGLWILNYQSASSVLFLLKFSVVDLLHSYENESLLISLTNPQMDTTPFHPLMMAFLNGKDSDLIWPIAHLIWDTKFIDLLFQRYEKRMNGNLLQALLKTLILMNKSSLLSCCSYYLVLCKWFMLKPELILEWFKDPRALNFMSECMSSGDSCLQGMAALVFSTALTNLVHVDPKGQQYAMKTMYPLILNRIGLEAFLNKLNQLEQQTVFSWNLNPSNFNKIAFLPSWSKFIHSQLITVSRALRAGPEHVAVPDSPDVIATYKQMVNKQQNEIQALKTQLAELQSNQSTSASVNSRSQMLEEELSQLKRKYAELEGEQEDLLVCLGTFLFI